MAKSQHTVPRLHLACFTGDNPKGHVWTYDKNGGAPRSAKPEETATFNHFYSIERDDGTWDTTVEDTLADCEGKAAPFYRKLITGETLTEEAKAAFAMFAALLYVRTPGYRLDTANLVAREHQILRYAYGAHERAFTTLIRRVEKEQGAPIDDELKRKLRRRLLDPSDLKIQVPKELALEGLEGCNRLAPCLFEMNWSVVEAKHGFFVTGDCPVVRWVHPKTIHPIRGDGGFKNPTAQVSLSLTPKLMLLMTPRGDIPARAVADRNCVTAWNHQRAYRAERHIYSHLKHSDLQKLATHFKGSRPTLTTAGFGPKEFGEVEIPRRRRRDAGLTPSAAAG